jgi:hypothetical protein
MVRRKALKSICNLHRLSPSPSLTVTKAVRKILKQVGCKGRMIGLTVGRESVKQVARKIWGTIADGGIFRQGEHEMRIKKMWRPRICRLVLRRCEFGGRRDRQGTRMDYKISSIFVRNYETRKTAEKLSHLSFNQNNITPLVLILNLAHRWPYS